MASRREGPWRSPAARSGRSRFANTRAGSLRPLKSGRADAAEKKTGASSVRSQVAQDKDGASQLPPP
jgi:hypothetical protein